MVTADKSRSSSQLPPWGATWVRLAALVLVPVLICTGVVLWVLVGTILPAALPAQLTTTKLEIAKIALTTGGGAGALLALILAARRQWEVERNNAETLRIRDSEISQRESQALSDREQRETVARQQEIDATQRRIADLFAAAANQLGNDRSAVRQAAFFSLEQLGNSHPETRQMVVNLICMYLRTPFRPPRPGDATHDIREREEEGLVRRSALDVLTRNLDHSRYDDSKWSGMWLNLEGAYIDRLVVMFGKIGLLNMHGATLAGVVMLGSCEFELNAIFRGARISENFTLAASTFSAHLEFADTEFDASVENDFLRDCWTDGFRASLPPGWHLSEERNTEGLQAIIRGEKRRTAV